MSTRTILTALGLFLAATVQAAPVFIANASGTPDSVKKEDLTAILEGKKTKWEGGPAIKLALLAEGETHEAVCKEFVGKSGDQLEKTWKKLVFTGKGVMPTVLKTDADVVDYVTKTPGALGYIGDAAAAGTAKVLTIE